MTKGRIYINESSKPAFGVEAELFTVSKNSYNLCPGAPIISAIEELDNGLFVQC